MSWPFAFTAWQFALAGAVCAAGPILIHLLNRRRYKVVQWAAMDFLREALQRNRRMMRLRDILLLILRTAAVLLFGLALAQPFFSTASEEFDSGQPLHAVLVLDNSLSMGYQSLEGDLLARAKDRARQFVEKLPPGSRISVIPLCNSAEGYSPDPYETKDAALEALDKIEVVDRSASLLRAANQAQQACEAAPELAKRIVLFSDQQQSNWRDLAAIEQWKTLPSMQVVDVSAPDWENTWIADLRLADGLADIETPTTIVVELMHRGPTPRRDLQVTLALGDAVLGEKTVTLEPGSGARQVEFEHVFDALSEAPEANRPVFAALRASIAPDRLPLDDERRLAAPVVAALPVVFVDQYGAEQEDVLQNRLGETRHLRKLLAPRTSRGDAARQLVQIRHVRIDELHQELLADARLVVIAGVQEPGSAAPLLKEYVRQGGQLMIAAGADFDPEAWQGGAWENGAGVLPLPLKSAPLGETPEKATGTIAPFFLAYESLAGQQEFQLPGTPETELRDLYAEPFFFKAVEVDASEEALAALAEAEAKRLGAELAALSAAAGRSAVLRVKEAKGEISEDERRQLREDEAQLRELRPQWLLWATALEGGDELQLAEDPAERGRQLASLAQSLQPKVLARFTDERGPAFLVERPLGRGRVLLATSGLLSSWNTLSKTNAFLMFDRLLRGMIGDTLPVRNFSPRERLTLPLPPEAGDVRVSLRRPKREKNPEPVDVGFIGQEQRGITLTNLLDRGLYRVSAVRESESAGGARELAEQPLWEIPLAVNGAAAESELDPLPRERFEELAAGSQLRWVGPGEEISLAGAAIRGQNSWWYLALAVLLVLLGEMALLAWPVVQEQRAAAAE